LRFYRLDSTTSIGGAASYSKTPRHAVGETLKISPAPALPVFELNTLCRYTFYVQVVDICTCAGMLKGDSADISRRIQIQDRVLIQISGFRNFPALELDVQGVGVVEILYFHGLNPRSKNAL
jgi:hypothetical protein